MKQTFTTEEALVKLKESFSTRIAQALESMTGATQRCYLISELNPSKDLPQDGTFLGWKAGYSVGPGVQLRVFASKDNWKLIGRTVLEAAGVDEFDDPTLEGTYIETLAQAASAWAPDLSGMAGKKWESTGSTTGAEPDLAAHCWGYRLPMGEGEAKVIVQVSEELMEALVQPEPVASGPTATAPATMEHALPASQFDLLLDVELPVSVSFGRALVPLKEVLKLSSGSIVELNRAVTEPVEVIVNNCVIARGEVVVVEGNYGVRIQQIVSRQDRLRTVN